MSSELLLKKPNWNLSTQINTTIETNLKIIQLTKLQTLKGI